MRTTIVYMANDNRRKGGWGDRLGQMLALYRISKDHGCDFKINFTQPFKLVDFLVPNRFDWYIQEHEIDNEPGSIKISNFKGYDGIDIYPECEKCGNDIDFEDYIVEKIKSGNYKQILCYTGSLENLINNQYSLLFHELFKISPELNKRIEVHKNVINEEYIAMVFRFQQLLGDFIERVIDPVLSPKQQIKLIKQNIQALKLAYNKNERKKILVCSDSKVFRDHAKKLKFVYTIGGFRKHPNNPQTSYEEAMLSFLDFFLITQAAKVISFTIPPMYSSSFPRLAAYTHDVPYECVIQGVNKKKRRDWIRFILKYPYLTKLKEKLRSYNIFP